MNTIKNINKENLINTYGIKPTLFYDVEGILVEKEGKAIKVESQVGEEVVTYTLKLREEVEEQVGEEVFIEKENIISSSFSIKEEVEEDEVRKVEDLFENIGIESTEENLETGEVLLKHNIPITKENIESFSMCQKYLNEVIEKLDYDSIIKLLKKDIDLEEESLQKIVEYVDEVEVEEDFSLAQLLGFKKELTYKEAEKISVQIYGRKMGKDIYDSIIALHREGIEINKKNIEKVREVVHKLHDLKDTENTDLIKVLKKALTPNIENIYKTKYSYDINKAEENIAVEIYDDFMIKTQATEEDIRKLLENLGIQVSEENISLVKQFILNNLEITIDNIEEIKDMRQALDMLIDSLEEEDISMLIKKDINPLKEDIRELVKIIKEDEIQEVFENKNIDIDDEKMGEIFEKIETLGKVKDEDLIFLLKKGEDFKLENLKSVSLTQNISDEQNSKVVDKVLKVSNIVNTLKELEPETITFTVKKFSAVSLNNLYKSEIVLKENDIKVEPIEKSTQNLIREEYFKARRSLSLNTIKRSVEENIDIEYMPLDELNDYIEKTTKYRRGEKILRKINSLKGKGNDLIPIAMKNGLDISIKELGRIDSFQKNENGLGKAIDDLIKQSKVIENPEFKQAIKEMEEKSKQLSNSLRKGKGEIKKQYKELMKDINDLANSFDSKEDERRKDRFKKIREALDIHKELSKQDLVLELPVSVEDGFENLQIIIPNLNLGINKDNMTFLLNLNGSNLGNIKFNLEVKGRDISVQFMTQEKNVPKLLKEQNIFKEGLSNIGYNLKDFSYKDDSYKNKKHKENYSLKAVDRRI